MLLLDYQNALIQSVLTERFSGAPPVHIDQTVSDFDGVTFHISTPEVKTKILLSLQIRCFKDLAKYGAEQVLQREYGQYVVPAEVGYDFSVLIDLENLPESKEERDALAMQFALLKRHAMAAPFEQAYEEHYKLKEEASKFSSEEAPKGVMEGGEVKAIHYREEEAIYVKASHDRVTVIFSTIFREETDRVYGKVFIQEFVDARRRAIQNAPQVLFRNDPPLELQGVPGVRDTGSGEIGYVTFVLFPRHLTPQRMAAVISHIQTFRDNFHYHIKASKAYIHSRMRKRTADFLQAWSLNLDPKPNTLDAKPTYGSQIQCEVGPLEAAKAWAPMVGFSLVGLAALQLYANYLRRIPGAAYVRPNFFRNRSLYGKVTSVGDGDNFHLFHTPGGKAVGWGWLRKVPESRKELKGRTIPIRIAAVDAPEGAHFGKPAQPYSDEALQWLRNYILHRNVRAYIYKTDQYERIVATVYVRRFLFRRNVGLEMIKSGLATVYEAKSGGEFGGLKQRYEKAEAKARRKRKGMWAGDPKTYESPREYKTKWASQQGKA
ncbi:hypothetical protein ACSS6W_003515 [Trichoderma asperelloides]